MAPRYHKNLTSLPRSGDVLTDWLFRQFVYVLREETLRIARKKRLINPEDPYRGVIRGLMDPEVDPSGRYIHILINPAREANRNRDEELGTLIHELAHVLMRETPERHILQLEGILATRLTATQRRYLKSFLPRHEVKRYPAMPAAPIRNVPLAARKRRPS
jgi:hypothetical protein